MRKLRSTVARLLPKSAFGQNVGILAGGTLFAQGLMALSLPALTRLYTPDDFALLAVYMAILGLLTAVASLRLNLAIPLPERDEEAMNLVALSVAAAVVVTAVLTVAVLADAATIARLLRHPEMEPLLWMVPVGVFLAAAYNALQYWATRRHRIQLVTRTRMTRAVGGAGTQLGVGLASPTPFGLLLGHMLYSGLGVLGLSRAMWREDRELFAAVGLDAARSALRRYSRFPLFSVPEALFNTGAIQLPILVIAAASAGPEAGYLMLAMQALGVPMALLGTSVAQVYLVEAPRRLREGTLPSFTRQAMLGLLKTGGVPLILAGAVSPLLFPLAFGEEWGRAGVIVAWMTPWFVLQFLTSPISAVLHVTGNISAAMALQAFGLALRLGSVLAAVSLAKQWLVEVYALSGMVFYGVYMLVIRWILARHEQ
jgi:O-antigen/teichoic acid export membrane protein